MDPIRNTGAVGPRDVRPEPHDSNPDGAEPRSVPPRTARAFETTVPLSPRRAMSGDRDAGPSSRPPRSAIPAHRMLPHLNAAVPDSPQSEMPRLAENMPGSSRPTLSDLNASPPRSPRAELLQSLDRPEAGEDLLAEFGIHGDPQPADLSRLMDLFAQRPELQPRFEPEVAARLQESIRRGLERELEQLLGVNFRAEFEADHDPQHDSIDGLEADLDRQHAPLGSEIQAWILLTGKPIESAHAFDGEDNAASFARLLARLRGPAPQGTSATPEQVSSVIQAIANDSDLRTQVFSLAEDALGSCGDNLAEGFSKIRLAVDNHRMEQAVESGQVSAKQLNDWAGSLFRLSLLESAVHRFIHTQLQRSDLPELERNALTNEPLETMVHAKVELRQLLELPNSTASEMRFRGCSVLGQGELSMLTQEVMAQADDGQEHDKFLLDHQTWRAGMKVLHAQNFKDLKVKLDGDPFFDLDVPPDLEGQAEYAAEALRVQAKYADEENALLLRLAAGGG